MKFQNEGGEFYKEQIPLTTIPTAAGNTDAIIAAYFEGKLVDATISFTDALAQHGSNYATFAIDNLSNGAANMLAATDANTTKTSTGSALTAHGKRNLTLHGTAANHAVNKNDRLRVRVTGTGTLANTLTQGVVTLTFQRTAR